MHIKMVSIVLLLAIIVSSCQSKLQTDIESTPFKGLSVSSKTVSRTPTSISEIYPSPTLYPNKNLPSFTGEIIPVSSKVIGIENIQNIRELSVWGSGWVTDLATSPDGSILAAASSIGLFLYNSETLIPINFLHYDAESLAFSPDGTILAIGLKRSEILLWNVPTNESMGQLLGLSGEVSSLAFSSDGKTLASGSGNRTITLWDIENQTEIFTLDGLGTYVMSRISTVLFSPDDKYLYSSDWDGTIRKWDIEKMEQVFSIKTNAKNSLDLSSDGTVLASSGFENNIIKLWESESGNNIGELVGHKGFIRRIEFSPKGKNLASCSYDGTIRIWDIETKQQIKLLQDITTSCSSVGYSQSGTVLYSASSTSLWSDQFVNTISKWDIAVGKIIITKTQRGLIEINSIALSPNGKLLASGSGSGTVNSSWGDVILWDMTNGTIIRTIEGDGELIYDVAFSPDGKILASVDYYGSLCLWEVETGKLLNSFSIKDGIINGETKITFSIDGKEIITVTSGLLTIWDFTGELSKKQIVIPREMNQFAFSDDKRYVAIGSLYTNYILVVEINSGKENQLLIGENYSISSLAYLPDGKKLAIGMHLGGIEIIDIVTGKIVQTFASQKIRINQMDFTTDGNIMVSSSADGRIILWNVITGKEIISLLGHTSGVNDIRISPDDKLIISGSEDQTIRIWGLLP
jgi:WD40 repeat protein